MTQKVSEHYSGAIIGYHAGVQPVQQGQLQDHGRISLPLRLGAIVVGQGPYIGGFQQLDHAISFGDTAGLACTPARPGRPSCDRTEWLESRWNDQHVAAEVLTGVPEGCRCGVISIE